MSIAETKVCARRWLLLVLGSTALVSVGAAFAESTDSRRIVPRSGAGQRRALVIGNDAYAHLPGLVNAVHDARGMKGVLEELGFEVQLETDTGAADLSRAVSAFAGRLKSGDVGLFYYSGHGLQIRGENFLIPIDFAAVDEIAARYASYPADQALQSLESSGAELNILILDACRDNPFTGTRSVLQGLAIMSAGRGTLIAFATGPGRTASDNPSGLNGLFTSHLIDKLRTPGLSIDQIFNQVTQAVDTASGGRQTPWVVKSLMGDFFFRPPDNGGGEVVERAFWDSVKGSGDAEELRAYLKNYPQGRFADLARIRLREFGDPGAESLEEPTCAPASACTRLGYDLQTRAGAEDHALAAVYYRQGCDMHDARACTNLGVMFENGQGVYGDDVKAAELYAGGCDNGDSLGCTYLGFMYLGGRGVPKSPVKAYEMLRLGCADSHSDACTHLGILYETGEGVNSRDYGRAGRFYSQGCAGRHAPGCRRLGLLYDKGLGVAIDPMQAAELYRLACGGKDAPACTSLGLLYSKGQGVKKNRDVAANLYLEGCNYGDPSGCENLRVLCREGAHPTCP